MPSAPAYCACRGSNANFFSDFIRVWGAIGIDAVNALIDNFNAGLAGFETILNELAESINIIIDGINALNPFEDIGRIEVSLGRVDPLPGGLGTLRAQLNEEQRIIDLSASAVGAEGAGQVVVNVQIAAPTGSVWTPGRARPAGAGHQRSDHRRPHPRIGAALMVDPVPDPPELGDSIYAGTVWNQQIRNPMRELPSQRASAAGQLIVGSGLREFILLPPPGRRSALALSGNAAQWTQGASFLAALGKIPPEALEASLRPPSPQSGDASRWLRVNSAANGFEITETAPWQ